MFLTFFVRDKPELDIYSLSESEEVYDEEFDTSIEHETYDETLTFDHHSLKILKNLQEIMTQSINKSDDELFESNDEVFQNDDQNDDETESLEEFEQPVPLIPNPNVKTAHCVIVDNDNDDNIIQRCTGPGERYLRQLSGAWEIDSQAVKDVKRDISALRICLCHLNFDQKTVHEFESKKEQSTNEMCEHIIQAPCVGLFKCPAITKYEDLSKKSLINDKTRFICTSCFVKNGGYLQIRPKKKGESLISCIERQLHETDTKSALKFLAKWIEQTAESEDKSPKNYTSILSTVPSCFLIKTAFAIKKIKVSEEQDQKQLLKNVTSHSLGSMLASSILQERSELKKKLSLLEEPKSFDEYYLAMPSSLVNFFYIRVLAYVKDHEVRTQKKRMLAADPRLRINLNPNVINIAAIDNIDLKDATFQYEQTFNIEHINKAIKANIDSTLFVDPPNVVILKPRKAPSKDEHVHKAVDMFLEDFGYTEDGVLNLVCDEAIYRHMKNYGLFGLATQLAVGVAIHQYIQTENISINNIPKTKNNILKICLMAFAPLFHITRKYRYAESVARFITELQNEPQLLQNLRTVPSINLTQEGHYFAFDEALETFGIKFLKEHMTGCATNLENLELNIKAAQTEYDRLNLLEFINQKPESSILFAKTTQLTEDGYQRMFTCYELGIKRMNSIIKQKTSVQAILIPMKVKNKKHVRGKTNQTATEETNQIITENFQALELNDGMEVEEINQSLQLESSSGLSHQKRQHSTHIPTDIEEQILIELEKYKDSTVLLPEIVEDLVEKLAVHTDYWTSKRIRDRWYNRYKRVKKKKKLQP
ncbi:hypothetical protein C2G38_2185794 [Gigaspora rosea]|uniref:Uncharacterized protein n=1 Tax=Gigaspora rosea TaxID=44941 RepID=A0A397VFB3_9GLOM|nr:hypothetical protein C2G38_2185794 [Gigaspora rosea]